jgi:hypothetical protein
MNTKILYKVKKHFIPSTNYNFFSGKRLGLDRLSAQGRIGNNPD